MMGFLRKSRGEMWIVADWGTALMIRSGSWVGLLSHPKGNFFMFFSYAGIWYSRYMLRFTSRISISRFSRYWQKVCDVDPAPITNAVLIFVYLSRQLAMPA